MGEKAPAVIWDGLRRCALIPEISNQLSKAKKGQVFRVWSKSGLHIVKTEDGKQDTGFALLMRVFCDKCGNMKMWKCGNVKMQG